MNGFNSLKSFDVDSFAALSESDANRATLETAEHFYHREDFRATLGFPQQYDFLVYYKLTREPYPQWLWRIAHQEARLRRSFLEGTAEVGSYGVLQSSKISEAHIQKLQSQELEALEEDCSSEARRLDWFQLMQRVLSWYKFEPVAN